MIKFRRMQLDDQALVLKWRKSERVTRMMFSHVSDSYKNQADWFKKINADRSMIYWVFYYGSCKLGVINLANIDSQNRTATAGYYIGDKRYLALGALVPVYLYNHAFFTLGLNKIYGHVLSSNKQVLKIHKLHGYDVVGTMKEHIFRNETYEDVVIIELLASKWSEAKRYHSYQFHEIGVRG